MPFLHRLPVGLLASWAKSGTLILNRHRFRRHVQSGGGESDMIEIAQTSLTFLQRAMSARHAEPMRSVRFSSGGAPSLKMVIKRMRMSHKKSTRPLCMSSTGLIECIVARYQGWWRFKVGDIRCICSDVHKADFGGRWARAL